ncbi:MAG: phosphoribosylformylglycinamidine synthase [Muribaculaceae bacterium]|nr:phosphoribosylformylglycinamidine synthase [Muribaculaceae bacterium]
MVVYFKKGVNTVYAVETEHKFTADELEKLVWLLGGAKALSATSLKGKYIGPRKEMITPWSTNAVEITQNMGLTGITRIEQFRRSTEEPAVYDKMLERVYDGLNSKTFTINRKPEDIVYIEDITEYNKREGLALSADEENYLRELSKRLGRPLTDSEVFGFSQVNSEHCRHKIFNGSFVIDGEEKESSLFGLIKKTSKENPNNLVSAYKDNVAFVTGPTVKQFYPTHPERPDYFDIEERETVLSLKAETHNFPTTVEPFNGAATGTGGEIRDRLGGGKASLPLAGTAVYMTSYPRMSPLHKWEAMMNPRVWLYQTPCDILIKASNGASDFGNKYGQPLICGSVLTFEHDENGRMYAYDKVIMLAGGVGYAMKRDAIKGIPEAGEAVVVMGGENYRIGMGGGAVSSVETGQYDNSIELNAVQRANPEMQKRVSNVIRALAENDDNPIVSIHDHGAGGHLNALSELVEATGGKIEMANLPIGDKTLSAKEIVGNESQERMGLVMKEEDIDHVRRIAERERAPMYVVGKTTGDDRFVFEQADGVRPIDLAMEDMFGNSPKTVMRDETVELTYKDVEYKESELDQYIAGVLSLEGVASKDWLTNKVDRSVTGKIARQQCQGVIQLPLSDCGVVALDYTGTAGIATSIGHAPQVALVDAGKGSVMAIAESLTNIVTSNLAEGLKSVSLSANWMWPCKNQGEDAALYRAVEACSDFACRLGINIPTGKDSLSMTQKYGDEKVYAPGTVIISAAGEVADVKKTVSPVVKPVKSTLIYIDFSGDKLKLGGSALAQSLNRLGADAPTVADAEKFKKAFAAVQKLVERGALLSAHDVSAGGLVTTLLEMTFANVNGGLTINTDGFVADGEDDLIKILFAENPALVVQVAESRLKSALSMLEKEGVKYHILGSPTKERALFVNHNGTERLLPIDYLRDVWMHTSYLMDSVQSGQACAEQRYHNYKRQPLKIAFPKDFDGDMESRGLTTGRHEKSGIKAAIIREKGVNGDREMAYSLYLAGFDVKDVHMTDLMSGRETLDDVNMIVFCGGFSNSDVLGSAKGWASGFKWNEQASETLKRYYAREDTLSLGVCNGCQLMIELNLINPEHEKPTKMEHNISHKFESQFVSVNIPRNNSVMLGSLAGSKLGIWVAHGEGRFKMPMPRESYNVAMKYNYTTYPGNPNGSPSGVAALCSADGRHLAMMPHLERAIFPWQWAYYPSNGSRHRITPWVDAFINARIWIGNKLKR